MKCFPCYKLFPTTLDVKNANKVLFFQNSKEDRITHFNISFAEKRYKDKI